MATRRHFMKNFLISGASLFTAPPCLNKIDELAQSSDVAQLDYYLTRDIPTNFYNSRSCYIHPRAGIVPGAGKKWLPRVVMTMNKADLSGSDRFKSMFGLYTNDLGYQWSVPRKLPHLCPRIRPINGIKHTVAASDFWPDYHKATKTLLGIGHTVLYTPDWGIKTNRPRFTSYSIYDANEYKWAPWNQLEMPDKKKFYNAGAGSVQRFDKKDGNILLPIYYKPPGKNYAVTVLLCSFDGQRLRYLNHGTELKHEVARGLVEPSLTRYKHEYFITIRNDIKGYVARSRDGLHFQPIQAWKFDDGRELGSYNTQQHWVTHSDGLFLIYTRRTPYNSHVMRSRAPLFMAQVDTERLCVLRKTERILVPNRGARLGNFGVTDVDTHETWVTVAEWMQPEGVERYGSNGSVWVARIHWNKPNLYFKFTK